VSNREQVALSTPSCTTAMQQLWVICSLLYASVTIDIIWYRSVVIFCNHSRSGYELIGLIWHHSWITDTVVYQWAQSLWWLDKQAPSTFLLLLRVSYGIQWMPS